MRAAGQKVTKSILGSLEHGQEVLVDDEVAWMPDRTSFAGSICTCDRLVRTAVKLAEIPLADAVKMMTLTPARIMGIDAAKGSIEVGKDADLVLFDEDIRIERMKKFDPKPMYAEDACVQMELLGHNFFVFVNAETDQVNVVYKRKGNTYGLIEPEI